MDNSPKTPLPASDDTRRSDGHSPEGTHAWSRWAPMVCVAVVGFGVSSASAWMIWTAAIVAFLAVVLPYHPMDYVYNHVVRRFTGSAPLPRNGSDKRQACLLTGLLLAGAGGAFFAGSASLGYALGVGSKLYMRFWDRPDALGVLTRVASSIPRFLERA